MPTIADIGQLIVLDSEGNYRIFFPESLSALITMTGTKKSLDDAIVELLADAKAYADTNNASISRPVPFALTNWTVANAYTGSCLGVALSNGTQVLLRVHATNTATAVTFALNGGAAIAVKNKGQDVSIGMLQQDSLITVRYDGTFWQIEDNDLTANFTPTTSGTGAAYTLTYPGIKSLVTNVIIPVKFATANTTTSPTFNLNSTGAKTIKRNGIDLAVGEIPANSYGFLIWDGTNYQLVGTRDIMANAKLINYTKTADTGDIANNDTFNVVLNKLQNRTDALASGLGGATLATTTIESNMVALAIEVALLKGAALFGMGDNMYIETLKTAGDVIITKGTYDAGSKKIIA